jgi:hypothetical protein
MKQTEKQPQTQSKAADADRAHLQDVDDGCGCTEIWEHMSDERDDE